MIPKEGTNMEVQHEFDQLVVILNNGTMNTIAKIQMTPIRNRAIRSDIILLSG